MKVVDDLDLELPPEYQALTPHQAKLRRLERLASLMDTRWRLPIFNVPFGWDTVLGLVPVVGDTFSSLISAYILKEGHSLGVPLWVKMVMLWKTDTASRTKARLSQLFNLSVRAVLAVVKRGI